jgi:hypothetical protein
MADPQKVPPSAGKPDELVKRLEKLEARIAELHDRLSQQHITEEDMKAFRKVCTVLEVQAGPTLFSCGHVGSCTRCTFLFMVSCSAVSSPKEEGEKPGNKFGDLGGDSA